MHKAVEYSAIPKLKARLRGEVISPGDEHYHQARRVWNGRIDKYPSLIVRCVDITDVLTTIEFARRWTSRSQSVVVATVWSATPSLMEASSSTFRL